MLKSNSYEKAMFLSDEKFKLLTGIKKKTAIQMLAILEDAYAQKHKHRGRHSKLSIPVMLMMALEYWRQYITFFELSFAYGVAESTAHSIVIWVEDTLIESGNFSLPGKKAMLSDSEIEIIVVDVTESQIERPRLSNDYYPKRDIMEVKKHFHQFH